VASAGIDRLAKMHYREYSFPCDVLWLLNTQQSDRFALMKPILSLALVFLAGFFNLFKLFLAKTCGADNH